MYKSELLGGAEEESEKYERVFVRDRNGLVRMTSCEEDFCNGSISLEGTL